MATSKIEGGKVTKNLTYSEQDKMESTKEINRDLNRYKLEKEGKLQY